MDTLKSKPDDINDSRAKVVVPNNDDANSYLKGMIEREHISYLHNKEFYQTRRNSLTASVPPPFKEVKDAAIATADAPDTKSGKEQQADLTNFRALKNLDEETICKNSEKRHQDNLTCDYDTLCQLQRKPIDLSNMCTTSKSTKVLSTTATTVQELFDIHKPKPNVIVDLVSLFYNNFFG
jgi:hypothetical protein